MVWGVSRTRNILSIFLLSLTGCASLFQNTDVALIREPGNRTYNHPPERIAESARALWEYAVESDNVYLGTSLARMAETQQGKACSLERTDRLEIRGWEKWPDVPSPELRKEADEVDLQLEVWEKQSSPPIIAVVFRGTEAERWGDWWANFRWFFRFVPGFRDQYIVVSEKVGAAVLDKMKGEIELGNSKYRHVKIVSTGHSLGGGLAQHLAYSFPDIKTADGKLMPRVSAVYAFDPSPVTGWYSVPRELREVNARGLHIDRVFEHGEILSYIRLLIRYLNPPQERDPAIREIRYNFVPSFNPFSSHSMRLIACELIRANGQSPAPLRETGKESGK
jgi:Lipase (class 3)